MNDMDILVDAPRISEHIKNMPVACKTFKPDSDRKILFTKDFAKKIIDMETFVGERPRRNDWVNQLTREAKLGRFQFELAEIVTCYCPYDNKERRLNGQHTAWMRYAMPDDWNHEIRHVKYTIHSDEDLRLLYSLIDNGAPRTASHIINARIVGSDKFVDEKSEPYSASICHLVSKGFKFSINDNLKTKTDTNGIADAMLNNELHICLKVAKILRRNSIAAGLKSKTGHVSRQSVIGAMFATIKKAEADSDAFWDRVTDGNNLSSTDPRKHLREYLMRVSPDKGRGASSELKSVPSDEIYGKCINAWNAFRDGKQIQQLKAVYGHNGRRATAK